MNMKSKNAVVIIVIGLIVQMFLYVFMFTDPASSYDQYASGECYFRARAKTTEPEDSLLWNTNLDMTQTKNVLLLSSGAKVYASNPHGPYCTVEYGDKVVEDFTLRRLTFLTEDDKDVFNGKKYTAEEYSALIEKIAADPSMQDMLSDKNMLPQKTSAIYPVSVICYSLLLGFIVYLVRDDEMWCEIILVGWFLVSVLFDIAYINII